MQSIQETKQNNQLSTNTDISSKTYFYWFVIFIQSSIATLGSLYYSTFGDPVVNIQSGNLFPLGGGFEPCTLCWFARILMYPITIISFVGIFKKDKNFINYVLPLAFIGIFLDSYHYYIQKFENTANFGCTLNNPCDAFYVNYFGFLTIPLLCLTAFVVIFVMGILAKKSLKN